MARALNNLARVYENKGDYEKAAALLQQAVSIWEKALGPQHPDVVVIGLGANDGLRGLDVQASRENLAAIIRKARSNDAALRYEHARAFRDDILRGRPFEAHTRNPLPDLVGAEQCGQTLRHAAEKRRLLSGSGALLSLERVPSIERGVSRRRTLLRCRVVDTSIFLKDMRVAPQQLLDDAGGARDPRDIAYLPKGAACGEGPLANLPGGLQGRAVHAVGQGSIRRPSLSGAEAPLRLELV